MDIVSIFVPSSWALLWWLFLVAMLLTYRRVIGYRQLNTLTFFLPLLFLTNGLFVPFSSGFNEVLSEVKLQHFDRYVYSLILMYLSFLIGFVLANLSRSSASKYINTKLISGVSHKQKTLIYLYIVLIISLVSIFQIYSSGLGFDLIAYVSGNMNYEAYAMHRYGFAEATSGKFEYYFYEKLPYGLAPLSIVLAWNLDGVKWYFRLAFFSILSFALIQTGHKLPIIMLVGYILISHFLFKRGFQISWKMKLGSALLFFGILLIVIPAFYFMQGERSYSSALYWSIERVLVESERTLQLYFEVYPDFHDFLYGASTKTVAFFMGQSDLFVPPSVYIPQEFLGGLQTSFPALFIGEAWADFGYFGVALFSILVSYTLQMYNVWFYSRGTRTKEAAALMLVTSLGAFHLLESNFLTTLITYGLAVNFLVYFLIRRPVRIKRVEPVIKISDSTLGGNVK